MRARVRRRNILLNDPTSDPANISQKVTHGTCKPAYTAQATYWRCASHLPSLWPFVRPSDGAHVRETLQVGLKFPSVAATPSASSHSPIHV